MKDRLHHYKKLKGTVVLQLISQDGSALGWQHPHAAAVNLAELSEHVTMKLKTNIKPDALQKLSSGIFFIPALSDTYQ